MDLLNLVEQAVSGNTDAIVELENQVKIARLSATETILHLASRHGNAAHVKYITKNFANENLLAKLNIAGQTALHVAALGDFTEVVKVLIEAARHLPSSSAHGNDIPISSFYDFIWCSDYGEKNTALHLALKKGSVASSKLILGACLPRYGDDMKNESGETPVYIAARNGFYDVVMLISRSWINLNFDGPDGCKTALHAAVKKLSQERVTDSEFMKLVNAFATHSRFESLFNRTDKSYDTVLTLAVRRKRMDLVELIMKADPGFQNGRVRKLSELKPLISLAAKKGYTEMVTLLSQTYDARYEIQHTGQTELHVAITKRDEDLVYDLFYASAHSIELAYKGDDENWKPVHYIAYYGFDSVLTKYFCNGLNPSEFRRERERERVPSPLYLAAKEGHTSTVIKLMELLPASFYTLVDSSSGQNILHLAAVLSKKEMILHILKKCPEVCVGELVNQQDLNGDTPLHLLIREGCFVSELIKHKQIDRRVKNKQDRTSLDMLYFHHQIIVDQAKIKKALDDFQDDQHWRLLMFWGRTINKKSSMPKCLVPSSERMAKDHDFMVVMKSLMIEKHKQTKDELDRYRQRTNIQIVVTALITTVTFTVGFTMPSGYHQDGKLKGMVILSSKKSFTAFMVSDALALLLSTSSLFLYFIASMYEDPQNVSKLNDASTFLNIVSVIAMMLTFMTGTYVVLSDSQALAISVIVISCFFFLLVISGLLIKLRYDRKQEEVYEV